MYSSSIEDRSAIRLAMARRRERREAERRRLRIRLRFFLFVAVAFVVAVLPRFFPEPSALGEAIDTPPEALVGSWTTVDTLYADRALHIGTDVVALDMGPGLREWYPILSTTAWVEEGYTGFSITYETIEGDEMEVEVHLLSDGTLRLRNPSHMIWTKGRLSWQIS